MLFQSRWWKYVLLALLAALVRQLRKRHRKSLVAPRRTSCSSCGTCHRQVYQLSPLKGGDGRYYCVACWKTFCDELPLCKCIAGNVEWCADCKMPATQINPVYLKDPYDANNDLQYRCKDCWFEVKADQTRFLYSNADILPMKHIRCPCIWPVDANTYSTWTLDALPSLILDSRSTYGANPQFTAGTWAKNEKCRHSSVRWDWCHKQSNVATTHAQCQRGYLGFASLQSFRKNGSLPTLGSRWK